MILRAYAVNSEDGTIQHYADLDIPAHMNVERDCVRLALGWNGPDRLSGLPFGVRYFEFEQFPQGLFFALSSIQTDHHLRQVTATFYPCLDFAYRLAAGVSRIGDSPGEEA